MPEVPQPTKEAYLGQTEDIPSHGIHATSHNTGMAPRHEHLVDEERSGFPVIGLEY